MPRTHVFNSGTWVYLGPTTCSFYHFPGAHSIGNQAVMVNSSLWLVWNERCLGDYLSARRILVVLCRCFLASMLQATQLHQGLPTTMV